MNPLVIYHANCSDGFCAAWIAHSVMPEAEFFPANYSEPAPDVADRTVYILDFSYKHEAMRTILKSALHVVVLDHHKTAEMELSGVAQGMTFALNPDIRFDMNKSGGRLAWEFFYPGKASPWLVDYTEDRDLWRFQLPDSEEVSAAIRSYPYSFGSWDSWAKYQKPPESLILSGSAILRYQKNLIHQAVANAAEVELDGHKILAVNSTVLFSEIAGELAKDRPFGAAFFIRGDGRKQWSLRSRDGGIDVSEVAKRHGGGGHRNAAGFEE